MKTRTSLAVMAALLLTTAAFAELQNRAAQRATERYESAVERAETEYASAMERATEQYRTELNQALQGAMRGGNVEEADEIRGVLAGLEDVTARTSATQDITDGHWVRVLANGECQVFMFNDNGIATVTSLPGRPTRPWRPVEGGIIINDGDAYQWRGDHFAGVDNVKDARLVPSPWNSEQ